MIVLQLKTILCLLFVTVHIQGKDVNVNSYCNIEGYYWRDYTGEIPKDAVVGGTDDRGRTTYIGQTLHPATCILPGKISKLDRKMFYEYAGLEHSAIQDVKILCSAHPERLLWVPVKNNESIHIIKNKQLILGGHDTNRPLLIGRFTLENGKLALGKVLVVSEHFQLIYIANEGKSFVRDGPYEVLVYDSTSSKYANVSGCNQKVINVNLYR